MFHREDMHATMRESAFGEKGKGPPAKLLTNRRVRTVDAEAGKITFDDGEVVVADLIIGGDGIRSVVRSQIGVEANITPAALACYRCNTHYDVIKEKGLKNFAEHGGIDYWCAGFLHSRMHP
jgi:salicylate hydroxylase